MLQKHQDEAWQETLRQLRLWLIQNTGVTRSVLIEDIFGKLRVVLWGKTTDLESIKPNLDQILKQTAGHWWTGDIWFSDKTHDAIIHTMAWDGGKQDDELPDRLRLQKRHRGRGAWFTDPQEPPWLTLGSKTVEGPPIVVFYSFKGGLGRSTALASFALQRAQQGERVAVVDFDLDAPGLRSLFSKENNDISASWGTVDYLLECEHDPPLSDYYHTFHQEEITGHGELLVFSAGRIDDNYLGKLAKTDLEPTSKTLAPEKVTQLLKAIQTQLKPHWILLDARTGLSEPAGALLSGIAHLHVLFGTLSGQSWDGLRLVIKRLGEQRVLMGKPQADCLLVQAMVPRVTESAKHATIPFADRAREEFSNSYYSETPDDSSTEETLWSLDDLDSEDAPHVPIFFPYDDKLAYFCNISDVIDLLSKGEEYRQLSERILGRFFEEKTDE